MEIVGSILACAFATACGAMTLYFEIRWRRRLRAWNWTTGRVVGFAETRPIKTLFGGEAVSDDGPWPEIEFLWDGAIHRFISEYGGSGLPRIGSEVDLLFDPATGKAEYFTFSTRWLGTVLPAIFSAVFYWVSFYGLFNAK